jgi:hypothetical protein
MNATVTPTPKRRPPAVRDTHYGAPMLDAGPFVAWLHDYKKRYRLSADQIGRLIRTDGSAVRRWLDGPDRISELVVEKVGLRLLGDPRLAAELYPELAA